MNNIFLLVRPDYDLTTAYLSYWCNNIIDYCNKNNIKYKDFKNRDISKEDVEKFLKKQIPSLIMFNCHGSEKCLQGVNESILVKEGDNDFLFNNKITYARSCKSAIELGGSIGKQGCFIGYKDDFIFPIDTNKTSIPLRDNLAGPVLEVSNGIIINLLKGKTAGESYNKIQELSIKRFYEIAHSDAEEAVFPILWALMSNKENRVLIGNPETKF